MSIRNFTATRKQQGFTLLEVLIALLVLSIGLLGLAALQTAGLRSNHMATMRTMTSHMAYDIADRMRTNPAGVAGQFYVLAWNAAPPAAPAPDCDDPARTSACTAQEMANSDLNEWRANVATLPGGISQIVRTVDGGGTVIHTITVFWDEGRTGASGRNCGADVEVDLRCMVLAHNVAP